jgi:hypothetical protein
VSRFRYTDEQVIDAIRRARGVKRVACLALRCDPTTLNDYIARSERIAEAYEEERGQIVDAAQAQLIAAVDARKWKAVRFTLVTLGRDRGFRLHHDKKPARSPSASYLGVQEALERVYGDHPSPFEGDRCSVSTAAREGLG